MALRGCAGPGRLRPAGTPVLIALINRQTAAALRRPKATFASAPLAVRRTIVEDSLRSVKGQRLLARPGGNLIEDLMAFYFQSSAANDLCYRAAIGREACRGLPGSEDPPSNSEILEMSQRHETDVLIIGGGISAALMAEKLAERQPAPSIIVVEAGQKIFDVENRMRRQAADARVWREPVARRHDRRPVWRRNYLADDGGGWICAALGRRDEPLFSERICVSSRCTASRSTGRSAGTSSSATTAKRSGASALPASRGRSPRIGGRNRIRCRRCPCRTTCVS